MSTASSAVRWRRRWRSTCAVSRASQCVAGDAPRVAGEAPWSANAAAAPPLPEPDPAPRSMRAPRSSVVRSRVAVDAPCRPSLSIPLSIISFVVGRSSAQSRRRARPSHAFAPVAARRHPCPGGGRASGSHRPGRAQRPHQFRPNRSCRSARSYPRARRGLRSERPDAMHRPPESWARAARPARDPAAKAGAGRRRERGPCGDDPPATTPVPRRRVPRRRGHRRSATERPPLSPAAAGGPTRRRGARSPAPPRPGSPRPRAGPTGSRRRGADRGGRRRRHSAGSGSAGRSGS